MDQVEIVSSSTSVQEEDKQSVLQLPLDLDRTWNNRDAQAFAALFHEDGDFRFHTGLWIRGRDAIESFLGEEVFPRLSEGLRHIATFKRVRFVTDEVAIGDGTLRQVASLEGQEQVHLETEGTMLVVKKGGRWRIAAVRLTALAPA